MPLRPFVSSFQKYVDVNATFLRPSYGKTAAADENASKRAVHNKAP